VTYPGAWQVQSQSNTHSHPVGKDESVLRAKGHFDEQTNEDLLDHYVSGVSAASLAKYLQTKSNSVTLNDITNLIYKEKTEYVAGRSDAEVTISQLESAGLPHKVKTANGPNGEVFPAVVWSYPEQIATFRKYPEVVIMDTTARTNNKALPLLILSGVDGNSRSFLVVNTLLYDETSASFLWAFECAQEFFGPDVCAAVHIIISDDDVGITSAMVQQVCTAKY